MFEKLAWMKGHRFFTMCPRRDPVPAASQETRTGYGFFPPVLSLPAGKAASQGARKSPVFLGSQFVSLLPGNGPFRGCAHQFEDMRCGHVNQEKVLPRVCSTGRGPALHHLLLPRRPGLAVGLLSVLSLPAWKAVSQVLEEVCLPGLVF